MKVKKHCSQTDGIQEKQFKGKFIATQTYLMKKKNLYHDLTLYLKHLEKRKSPKLAEGRNQYRSEYK